MATLQHQRINFDINAFLFKVFHLLLTNKQRVSRLLNVEESKGKSENFTTTIKMVGILYSLLLCDYLLLS
jgi:hypothetical protein